MSIKKNLSLSVFFVLLIIVSACVNDKSKNQKENKPTELIELDNDVPVIDDKIFYRFPSPEEVFKYIKTVNLEYNNGSVNNPLSYKSYLGIQKQTVNLGIYIADLTYITMFNQQEESLDYFASIHNLSEELKISSAFKKPLINRISENLENADSLIVIASDAYSIIVEYLVKNDQNDLLALMAAGVLIESLYLTLDQVTTYDPNNVLLKKIINQKFVVNNIHDFAKQQEEKNPSVAEVVVELKSIADIFNGLKKETTNTQVKTKDKKLIIGGGKKLTMNKEEFDSLKMTVSKIRNKYTKTN